MEKLITMGNTLQLLPKRLNFDCEIGTKSNNRI